MQARSFTDLYADFQGQRSESVRGLSLKTSYTVANARTEGIASTSSQNFIAAVPAELTLSLKQ